MIGETINGYYIDEDGEIGVGGFAEVYVGKNQYGFKKAFKVVRPDKAEHNSDLCKRFRKEISMLMALGECREIVRAENVHQHENTNTTVLEMEYLDGRDFAKYISEVAPQGIKDADLLKKIAIKVLTALDFAHNKDILHLDVKPNNVFFTNAGYVVLLDFGIAKVVGEEAEKIQGVENITMLSDTGESTFRGNPMFASPEQQAGVKLTVASDIYSFGKTLHFLATGTADVNAADVTIEPFASIVDKCTQPKIRNRYTSCKEILEVLNGGYKSTGGGYNPPPPTAKRCGNASCPRKEERYEMNWSYCSWCGTKSLINC